jgi:hypothetical protein
MSPMNSINGSLCRNGARLLVLAPKGSQPILVTSRMMPTLTLPNGTRLPKPGPFFAQLGEAGMLSTLNLRSFVTTCLECAPGCG